MQYIKKIEGDLCEAADQLRANSKLTASEYSMPVLGLIFLRHAYNRFLVAKDKIEEKPVFHGCPGTRMKIMDHKAEEVATEQTATVSSQLSQWPVQIKLEPVNAPYFKDENLLIAADCTAYAYGNFHQKFIKNIVTLIGCPKLDEGDYSEKLTQIIANNDI